MALCCIIQYNTNNLLSPSSLIFAFMDNERLKTIISKITRGDTSQLEHFFKKSGGKTYLQIITLILIHQLPAAYDRDELYAAFMDIMNRMEKRIERQVQGDEILAQVFANP